jgi:hypothetical protein
MKRARNPAPGFGSAVRSGPLRTSLSGQLARRQDSAQFHELPRFGGTLAVCAQSIFLAPLAGFIAAAKSVLYMRGVLAPDTESRISNLESEIWEYQSAIRDQQTALENS